MPSLLDHILAEKSARDSAPRLHLRLRAAPRVESLETRCLMSGWHPTNATYRDSPLPVRGTAVTTQTNDVTTLPGVPGLPQGPYVVVAETKDPHQTLATAQELPDLPYFGVVGTIGSGDPIDLYRLTLSSPPQRLDFALVSNQSTLTVPMQFQLFDGSGQVLGVWSLDGQGTPSLHGELGGLPAGSTLYLGITAGNPNEPGRSSATIDYQLWISLQSATDRSTIATSAVTSVASLTMTPEIASPLPASTNPAVQPSAGDSTATPTSPPNQPDGSRVAVGSPAMRSARPSGGLLSDDDPTPLAARDFNADVVKECDERLLTGPTSPDGTEVEPTALSARENQPDGLVVIHGPGGFPLLGAVAIGHRRGNPATNVGDFSTPRVRGDWGPEVAAGIAAQEFLANSDIAVTEGGDTAQSRALPARGWGQFPGPVFSGLGLATVFTLNAVLSQPIAGFDYLTTRMDANGRPLPYRKYRRGKPTAPPHRSSPFDDPPR